MRDASEKDAKTNRDIHIFLLELPAIERLGVQIGKRSPALRDIHEYLFHAHKCDMQRSIN